jgi:hypothetical protein
MPCYECPYSTTDIDFSDAFPSRIKAKPAIVYATLEGPNGKIELLLTCPAFLDQR